MPDGQRSSSKGDKGLTAPTDENFLYAACDENEGTDEELTAIVKQVSRVNFNNFLRSDRFQAGRMMDGKDVDLKGSLKLGGDLVVLSVVLNKKQKDNDEVALAIDRLRKNGVNCVFFTMNDMRNGTSKSSTAADNEGSETLRRSTGKRHNGSSVSSLPPAQHTPSCLDGTIHPDLGSVSSSKNAEVTVTNVESDADAAPTQSLTNGNTPNSSGEKASLRKRPRQGAVSLKTSKPEALPVQEVSESSVQHDHLLPPLLSPAEPEPVSAQLTLPHSRKRRRRRKCPAYSVNPARGKAKRKKAELHASVLAKKRKMTNVEGDCPPLIEPSPPLQQISPVPSETGSLEDGTDLPPVLVRADLDLIPQQPKRRVRKSKEERIEEVLRASVAICGATPEVVLGQRRKCTTKTKPPLVFTRQLTFKLVTVPDQSTDPAAPEPDVAVPEVLKVSIPLSQVKLQVQATANPENLANNIISSSDTTEPALVSTETCILNPEEPGSEKSKLRTKRIVPNVMRKTTRSHSLEEKYRSLTKLNGGKRDYSPDVVSRFARARKIGNRKTSSPRSTAVPDITSLDNIYGWSPRTSRTHQSVQLPRISDMEPGPRTVQRSISLNSCPSSSLDLSPLECLEKETQSTLEKILTAVVSSVENESDPALQHVKLHVAHPEESGEPEPEAVEVDCTMANETVDQKTDLLAAVPSTSTNSNDDSLPDFPFPDSMKLRRSSFFSLITGNVRTNMEKYLDGRSPAASAKSVKRRRRPKNGFLLHHGDNCPEDPEAPYKLHLATQVLIKLNKRRSKVGPKEDRGKTLLSYLKLVPKRPVRASKPAPKVEEKPAEEEEKPVFSGEWTIDRKYVCGICGATENCFWDMATHKGEEHPGVLVTHIELPINQEPPSSLIRESPGVTNAPAAPPPPCTKCSATFSSFSDLHGHIFACAGNTSWLEEKVVKKPKGRRRKRGFKRRFSATPKKPTKKSDVPSTPKRRSSEPFKCEFCVREFKTEGWLRNHMTTHSLPVSIPLDKLPLASLPVRACLRKLKY